MIEIIEKTQEFTSASDNSVLEAAGKNPSKTWLWYKRPKPPKRSREKTSDGTTY